MLTFLLWNLNRQRPGHHLGRLVATHRVDVVILLESGYRSSGDILTLLNATADPIFHLPPTTTKPVTIVTRFSSRFTTPIHEGPRLTIRRIALPAREEFLLAATHFPSKLWMKDHSQAVECGNLARDIRAAEAAAGHTRTLLVGDLNMNPFDSGMIAAGSLNAVMTRQVAARGSRRVQRQDYPFFYNPMWGLFGDGSRGPAGTYYRDSAEHHDYFWHMFDQVLVRPGLLQQFPTDGVTILSDDGTDSLLNAKGLLDASCPSDHLPLLFKLNV
jgi:hypothetical protein